MAKVIVVTIEENGDLIFLKADSADYFLEHGEVVTRRASNVEPYDLFHRVLFHVLRTFFSDKSRIADWTRIWKCAWRVNTSPIGGPILTWGDVFPVFKGTLIRGKILGWSVRTTAIEAEVAFLNHWFAERTM
jgi:hypothetical protein